MRRWLLMFLVGFGSIFFLPSVAGCAKGDSAPRRRTDAGHAALFSVDAASPPVRTSLDASVSSIDASRALSDAGRARTPMPESCNGEDDDLDSRIDEDFLCPEGQMGEICVTSCGANGYRICEAPSCSWSVTCHTFDEVCGDTLDNDCDGSVDEDCGSNPAEWACDESMSRIRLEPDSRLGPCSEGWTLVLWGSGGALEEYSSLPGHALDVSIRDDWVGWSAFTAYCGDWERVRRWESAEGRLATESGITVIIDGATVPVQVCYDPGGDIVRPLIPVQCGLPACPGRSY
jgi:hypothetical protein